jgi:hypothetical protein
LAPCQWNPEQSRSVEVTLVLFSKLPPRAVFVSNGPFRSGICRGATLIDARIPDPLLNLLLISCLLFTSAAVRENEETEDLLRDRLL